MELNHKRIYLVRHGQTDYNVANIVQGRGLNPDLNSTGKQQALQFFKFYRDFPIDYIFTSTLVRTQQTVMWFIARGIPWQPMHHLDEIGWGELEGKPAELAKDRFHDLLSDWAKGSLERKINGGESPLELQLKHKRFIEHYRSLPHKNILICSHGRAMRILLSTMLDTPLEQMDQYKHSNTCVYTLVDDGKKIVLESANCLEHLVHEAV